MKRICTALVIASLGLLPALPAGAGPSTTNVFDVVETHVSLVPCASKPVALVTNSARVVQHENVGANGSVHLIEHRSGWTEVVLGDDGEDSFVPDPESPTYSGRFSWTLSVNIGPNETVTFPFTSTLRGSDGSRLGFTMLIRFQTAATGEVTVDLFEVHCRG